MKPLTRSALTLSITLLLALPVAASAAYRTGTPPDDTPRNTTPLLVTPWAKRTVHDGIAYFLYPGSTKITRFDLDAQNWLADIVIPAGALSFDADADGIFISFGDRVARLSLDGSTSENLPNIPGGQTTLELGPGFILVASGQQFRTFSKAQGTALGSTSIWYTIQGISEMAANGRIYMSYIGLSPSDIVAITANPATGALSSSLESPYHGAWPAGSLNHTGAQGTLVVDNTGTAYSDQLIYRGSLGGQVSAVAFLPDRFVVLRGNELIVFSNALRELGRLPAPGGTADLFVSDGGVHAVTNSGAVAVTALDLTTARKPTPGNARNWTMTSMHADEILDAGNGVLFVNKSESAAYRFDPQTWAIAAPLPLLAGPDRVAYSAVLDTLFASYQGGAIYGHPFAESGTATYLNSTAFTPHGLATADDVVMAADASGAWDSHYTFGSDGQRKSWVEWNYLSSVYTWDSTTRRMYFFRDGTSPNDLHWEELNANGEIIAEGESAYHGELQARPPIRISPNHATIVLGSGQMLSATSLTFTGNLQQQVADVAWSSGELYAVSTESPARLLRYDSAQNIVSSGRVRGAPRRLVTMNDGNLLYIAEVSGRTVAGVLDPFLTQADLAIDTPSVSGLVSGGSTVNVSVTVGNNGSVAAQGVRVTADLSAFQNVSWRCVPDALATGCDDQPHSGVLDQTISLGDSGQVRYLITATVPASAAGAVSFPMQVSAATNASDPELRNNGTLVGFRLDRLFKDGFQQ